MLKSEFKKGREACAKILLGKEKWPHLWQPVPFFQMYKHYLQVTIVARNEGDFKKWEGWVHSRLRMLVRTGAFPNPNTVYCPWSSALCPVTFTSTGNAT